MMFWQRTHEQNYKPRLLPGGYWTTRTLRALSMHPCVPWSQCTCRRTSADRISSQCPRPQWVMPRRSRESDAHDAFAGLRPSELPGSRRQAKPLHSEDCPPS